MIKSTREKLNILRGREDGYKNVVLYSYKMSKHDHINDHEVRRLEHSIRSIREFNNEIPVYLFCDKPSFIPPYFRTHYNVNVLPFEDGFDHDMLNAWSIHRWYNLRYFDKELLNILYVDSDTIFYHDVEYLFDTYCTHEIYGREEFGFAYEPTIGGDKNIRKQLDTVDACIYDLGGITPVYKYCCGVMLLNNGSHIDIVNNLNELTELMSKFKTNEIFLPIPNRRIVDQYAIWVLLSKIGLDCGLFAIQDVTQGYLEEKHRNFFNPVVLHYTTNKEQEFAASNEKFSNLRRDVKGSSVHIDPYQDISEQTIDHLPPELIELLAEDNGIVAENL